MYLKELKEGTQTDSSVHSSIIYHSQKVETTQMSINRWMDKQNVIYTMECYSALKRNDIVTHATTWVNTEHIKLNVRYKRTNIR